MSDAHEVAVRAVAAVIHDVRCSCGMLHTPRVYAGYSVEAARMLAALNTPEVRAALVDVLAERLSWNRAESAADAVLDALAGAERGERG